MANDKTTEIGVQVHLEKQSFMVSMGSFMAQNDTSWLISGTHNEGGDRRRPIMNNHEPRIG
jgi:hypothetical protein